MNSLSSATGKRTTRRASPKRQLRSHEARRTSLEADPGVSAEERTIKLSYHDWIIERLRA